MVLERLSQRIEMARAHAITLQRQAGALEPAATAALDQAVEELRAALDELQAAEEQAREQEDALLAARAAIEAERKLEGVRWLVQEPRARRHPAPSADTEATRLRDLLDALPDGVLVHERDGRIVLANRQTVELFGYSQDELLGQTAELLMPERFRARHVEHRAGYAAAPRTRPMGVGLELIGRRKDGSEFPVDISLGTVRTDGRVLLISTVRDVTDRRLLEEMRARLAAIVETATDAIIGKTVQGLVTSWNPGAERLFGYTAAEMIGQPFARLAPSEARDEYQLALTHVRRDIRVPPFDTVRVHKDGRRLEVSVSLSPIVDGAGTVIGVSVVVQDISERRALEHLRDELQALTSRELRSPLGAIRAYAELIERQQRFDSAAVQGIIEQSEHLDRLVGDLADDALIEAGRVELQPRSVDLAVLVRSAAHRFTVRGGTHTLLVEAPPNRAIGRWDRDRLTQVLDDLLDVATRHVPAGVEAVIRIVARDDAAIVTVTAQGAGPRPEQLQGLFDRLPRLPDVGRSRGGPLNLRIARMLVEAHGGRLWVEVKDGPRAVFSLHLPYAPPVVGGRPPRHLTPRQLEIVAHIAQGKSNRQIAAALVLSQTAVENHVGRILRRLGVRNRAAVASWAVEHGLAHGSQR